MLRQIMHLPTSAHSSTCHHSWNSPPPPSQVPQPTWYWKWLFKSGGDPVYLLLDSVTIMHMHISQIKWQKPCSFIVPTLNGTFARTQYKSQGSDLEKYCCERDFDGKYVPTNYFNCLQIVINQSRSASEYVKDQSSLVDGILNGRLAMFDFNNTLSSACPEAADPCLMITNKNVAYVKYQLNLMAF